MKKVPLISLGFLFQITIQAQQPIAPAPSIPQKHRAPPNSAQTPNNPSATFAQTNRIDNPLNTNQASSRPPVDANNPQGTFAQTNQIDNPPNTNQAFSRPPVNANNPQGTFAQTNRLDNPLNTNQAFNRPPLPTNNPNATFAQTNQLDGSANPNSAANTGNSGAALAVTNSLAHMAPAQATSVVQFQSSLNTLQALVANLNNVQNAQEIVQQNPAVQQQLTQVEGQIHALTRGQKRLSDGAVQRLSRDLVLVVLPGRTMNGDRQLALAVLINQACNSANLTAAQTETTANHSLLLLQDAGVPPAQAQLIIADLQAIVAELRPGG